ncbi:MAG TPA: hypothetical protein VHL57_04930, partial [Flavobacteriales bacterium]|nr:hypothetical protein [Flavobacteriales bacterium]
MHPFPSFFATSLMNAARGSLHRHVLRIVFSWCTVLGIARSVCWADTYFVPDPALRQYLEVHFPSAMDAGNLDGSDPSVQATDWLDLTGLGIHSLEGLQA